MAKKPKNTNYPITDPQSNNLGDNHDQYLDLFNKIGELGDLRSSINKLGTELSDTTVSKEYFNAIFTEQAQHVFIVSYKMKVLDYNKAINTANTGKENLDLYIKTENQELKKSVKKCISDKHSVSLEGTLLLSELEIPVSIKISIMPPESSEQLIVSCTDLSAIKENEKESLKNIILAQEHERNRVAQDLHDEIGQQINGLRLYMNVIEKYLPKEGKAQSVLERCNDVINSMSQEIRSVCFNLMPRTLNDFGLVTAVEMYVEKSKLNCTAKFQINSSPGFPRFNTEFEINIYRIIQEFVSNSIKYSQAKKISIALDWNNDNFTLTLKDDGKGFDIAQNYNGMGLQNILTRCKFLNARQQWQSQKNKGTQLQLQAYCQKS